jgi:hypothetical protein
VAFPSFAAGAEAVREIVQAGLRPANCRLIDAREAALTFAGDGSAALLVLGFEEVVEGADRAWSVCRSHGGQVQEGSGGGGGAWRSAFLRAPYLRDTLVAMGVLSETFETAVTWERLPGLVAAVSAAVVEAVGEGIVTCRLTHAYPDGAAPYFTVLAPASAATRRRSGAPSRRWPATPCSPRAGRSPTITRSAATTGAGTTASGRSRSPTRCTPPRPCSIRTGCSIRGTLGGEMSIDASAKNMQAVCKAKEHHDKTCPWRGKGNAVHLSWFDIERMGWEEGDVICGLVVVGDERVSTGMMRVTCDAEPDDDRFEEEEQEEVVEAVSDRELVTVTPEGAPAEPGVPR